MYEKSLSEALRFFDGKFSNKTRVVVNVLVCRAILSCTFRLFPSVDLLNYGNFTKYLEGRQYADGVEINIGGF